MGDFSILGECSAQPEGEVPEYFRDLNLDVLMREMNQSVNEYDLEPYFYALPKTKKDILYRQDVLKSIDAELEQKLRDFQVGIRESWKYEEYAEKVEDSESKAHWYLLSACIYFQTVDELLVQLEEGDLKAQGWQDFVAECRREMETAGYRENHDKALAIKAELEKFRYTLRIEGDNVTILPELVEDNYVEALCEKYPHILKKPGKLDHLLPGSQESTKLEKSIFRYIRKKNPKPFQDMGQFHLSCRSFRQPHIIQFHEEISFYLSYLKFQHHMEYYQYPFCYPEFCETDFEVKAGYDLALAFRNQSEGKVTVSNDYYFNKGEQFFVVTGPNQGGKTTFGRAAGQLVYFSLMGLPVPAKSAKLPLFDGVMTHFSVEESMESGRGKLKEELVRLSGMMNQEAKHYFVVINELFTSAATYDAFRMGRRVMDHFLERDCLGIYVTHIEELAKEDGHIVSMVASLADEGGNRYVRTYKVSRRKAAGKGYVEPIVEKYGLTYEEVAARIPSGNGGV